MTFRTRAERTKIPVFGGQKMVDPDFRTKILATMSP